MRGGRLSGMTVRERFVKEVTQLHREGLVEDLQYLIVAIQLPSTGAVEIITNTKEIGSKIDYYLTRGW